MVWITSDGAGILLVILISRNEYNRDSGAAQVELYSNCNLRITVGTLHLEWRRKPDRSVVLVDLYPLPGWAHRYGSASPSTRSPRTQACRGAGSTVAPFSSVCSLNTFAVGLRATFALRLSTGGGLNLRRRTAAGHPPVLSRLTAMPMEPRADSSNWRIPDQNLLHLSGASVAKDMRAKRRNSRLVRRNQHHRAGFASRDDSVR